MGHWYFERDRSKLATWDTDRLAEHRVVLGPKSYQNSREIGYGEIVFRPLYVHHQTLCGERFPDPLVIVTLYPPRL